MLETSSSRRLSCIRASRLLAELASSDVYSRTVSRLRRLTLMPHSGPLPSPFTLLDCLTDELSVRMAAASTVAAYWRRLEAVRLARSRAYGSAASLWVSRLNSCKWAGFPLVSRRLQSLASLTVALVDRIAHACPAPHRASVSALLSRSLVSGMSACTPPLMAQTDALTRVTPVVQGLLDARVAFFVSCRDAVVRCLFRWAAVQRRKRRHAAAAVLVAAWRAVSVAKKVSARGRAASLLSAVRSCTSAHSHTHAAKALRQCEFVCRSASPSGRVPSRLLTASFLSALPALLSPVVAQPVGTLSSCPHALALCQSVHDARLATLNKCQTVVAASYRAHTRRLFTRGHALGSLYHSSVVCVCTSVRAAPAEAAARTAAASCAALLSVYNANRCSPNVLSGFLSGSASTTSTVVAEGVMRRYDGETTPTLLSPGWEKRADTTAAALTEFVNGRLLDRLHLLNTSAAIVVNMFRVSRGYQQSRARAIGAALTVIQQEACTCSYFWIRAVEKQGLWLSQTKVRAVVHLPARRFAAMYT